MRLWILIFLLLAAPAAAAPRAAAGPFEVEVATDPAVIPVGRARILVTVKHSGQPVDGATVKVLAEMPGMKMGERDETAKAVPGQPGAYAAPAAFPMGGAYNVTVTVASTHGNGRAVLSLQTGQDTSRGGGPNLLIVAALAGLLAIALLAWRAARRGEGWSWGVLLHRDVLFGSLLIAVVLVGAVLAVRQFRRPGSMTPIEAQSMEMSMPAPPGTMPVEIAVARRGTVASTVRYSGQAVGFSEVDVAPRVEGIVTELSVYAGDRVRAGQVVARLDTSQIEPQLREKQAASRVAQQAPAVARAEMSEALALLDQANAELSARHGAVSEAQGMLRDARAMLQSARSTNVYRVAQFKRSQALFADQVISAEELQKDRAEADAAAAEVERAEAAVQQAQAQVRQARSDLDAHHAHVHATEAALQARRQKVTQAEAEAEQAVASEAIVATMRGYATVVSPLDGVVTQRLVSPGVLAPAGQPLLRVAQIRPIRLQANVAASDAHRMQLGSAVSVRDADGKVPLLMARVTSVAPLADPTARTAIVEAVVPNRDERFLPGNYVVLDIEVARAVDAVFVPSIAVQRRSVVAPAQHETAFVWVARQETGTWKVSPVDVTLGVSDGSRTVIKSGLQAGASVVTSGQAALTDGMTVQPRQTEAPTPAAAAPSQATVTVTEKGFEPDRIALQAGSPARLTFIRKTDATCGTDVLMPDYDIKVALPLNKPVVVSFVPKPGETVFTCGMKMLRGTVVGK